MSVLTSRSRPAGTEASAGGAGVGSDGGGSDHGASGESGRLHRPGVEVPSDSANLDAGIVSIGPPMPDPAVSAPPDGAGDSNAVPLAESTSNGAQGQVAGNLPGASATTEATATKTVKKKLATYKVLENEESHNYGRARSETRKNHRQRRGGLSEGAARNLNEVTRRALALLATVEQPKNELIWERRQNDERKPQS